MTSWSGVVILAVSGVVTGTRYTERWPPFGWITVASCVSALAAVAIAVCVRLVRGVPQASDLAQRVIVAAPVALLASCVVWYLIFAFVHGSD